MSEFIVTDVWIINPNCIKQIELEGKEGTVYFTDGTDESIDDELFYMIKDQFLQMKTKHGDLLKCNQIIAEHGAKD